MTYADKFFKLLKPYKTDLTKVRLGSLNDGGYVVPEEIVKNILNVYSFGIGNDANFEYAMAEKYGAYLTGYDPNPQQVGEMFIVPRGVGTGEKKTPMREWRKTFQYPCLVKVDIEGDEWDAIDYFGGYEVLIIELHILTVENLGSRSPYFTELYNNHYAKINEELFKKYFFFLDAILNSYFIFHMHGNNSLPKTKCAGYEFPPLLELTLVNRKYEGNIISPDFEFPQEVDKPNKTDRPDFISLFPFKP